MTADRYKYWLQRHDWHGTTLHDERERESLEHLALQNPPFEHLLYHAQYCVRQGRPITFDENATPFEKVKAALLFVSPDCSYCDWVETARVLKTQFKNQEKEAFEAFDSWSSLGKKYPGSDNTKKIWNAIKTDEANFDGGITLPAENHKQTKNNTMTEILKAIRAELIDPIVAAINSLAANLGNAPVPTAPAQTPESAPKKEKKTKAPAPVSEPEPATTAPAEASEETAPETPAASAAPDAPAADAGHGITFEDIKAHVESIRSMPDAAEKRERIKKFLKDKCGGAPSTAECDPQYYPALLKGLQKLGATDTRKKDSEDI